MSESIDTKPLHLLYRPENLDEVVGQRAAKASLAASISEGKLHAYLFTGPSGVGKTTLARILARGLNCEGRNIREYDAATFSGADDMRDLCESIAFKGWGASPNVCVILDECHALSKQAWQVVLKSLEEPPAHVYWCLCTTEKSKVPKTIVTRCATYDLKLLNLKELENLLDDVCEDQSITITPKIKDMIVQKAEGSARQALVLLGQVRDVTDVELAEGLLGETEAMAIGPLELARVLTNPNFSLKQAYSKVKSISNDDPEYVKTCIRGYITACCLNEANEAKLDYFGRVLEAFTGHGNIWEQRERMAPVLAAIWKVKHD